MLKLAELSKSSKTQRQTQKKPIRISDGLSCVSRGKIKVKSGTKDLFIFFFAIPNLWNILYNTIDMIIPLFLLTNDITCHSVSPQFVTTDQGTYVAWQLQSPNFQPPNCLVETFNYNTAKFTVIANAVCSGYNPFVEVAHWGTAEFNFKLSSVNQTPGTENLTVWFSGYNQAIATTHTDSYSGAQAWSDTQQERRHAYVGSTGFDDDKSATVPNPVVPKLVKWKGTVTWVETNLGYRTCIVKYATQEVKGKGKITYVGPHVGTIVEATGTGQAWNKVTFNRAEHGSGPGAGLKFNALGLMSDRELLLKLSNQYGAPVEEFSNMTSNGQTDTDFEVTSSGTYNLKISGKGFLSKTIPITLVVNSIANLGNVELYKGDINGDNIINPTDISLITSYLGVTSSSDLWHFQPLTQTTVPKTAISTGTIPLTRLT